MSDTPKRIKRLLREHAGKAHEEDLRQALVPLAEAFKRWGRGELDSFDLSGLIHEFHQGPARQIYVRYDGSSAPAVAGAIVAGILKRNEVPAELLEYLSGLIKAFEDVPPESEA
jgi:hypothetical protein